MLRVLLVEDDRDVAANVAEYLAPRGYTIDFAYDGSAALERLRSEHFDVVVLDIGLPKLDGVGVSQELRRFGDEVPVLVITARDSLADKTEAFSVGVDDYLVKPFALAELELRLVALHRRAQRSGHAQILQVADLRFDTGTRRVTRAGQELTLNRSQQQILEILMRASPEVVTRETLTARLWGGESPGDDTLRTHLFELRARVDKPFDSPLLRTLRGIGYAIADPEYNSE